MTVFEIRAFKASDKDRTSLYGWALVQYDWRLCKKRLRQDDTLTGDNHVRTQQGGSPSGEPRREKADLPIP